MPSPSSGVQPRVGRLGRHSLLGPRAPPALRTGSPSVAKLVREHTVAPSGAGSQTHRKGLLTSLRPAWTSFGSKSRSPTPSTTSETSEVPEVSDASSDLQDFQPTEAAPMFWEDGETYLHWCQALDGRSPVDLSTEELRPLVRRGMPLKHRLALWPQWFGARAASYAGQDVGALEQVIGKDTGRLIDLDVPRTLPQLLSSGEQDSLRRLLRARASMGPDLGYCQGINNIAAIFVILGFDEATALHGLNTLLEACCPGYHDPTLSGFHRDAWVLGDLVQRLLPPSTRTALEHLGVPLKILASEHFLSLASKAWPLTATVHLWDLILMEGAPALFASFLALLELYLPSEDEQLAVESEIAAGVDEALEPVEVFRQAVLQGVAGDFGSLARRIHELMDQLPMSLIEKCRLAYDGV